MNSRIPIKRRNMDQFCLMYSVRVLHFLKVQCILHFRNILPPKAQPTILSKPRKIYAYEATSVTLNCVAVGMPKPELIWYYEDTLLVKNKMLVLTANPVKYQYWAKNGSLTVSNLIFQDSGAYSCTASSIDKFTPATINYTVKGKYFMSNLLFYIYKQKYENFPYQY